MDSRIILAGIILAGSSAVCMTLITGADALSGFLSGVACGF